MLYSLLGYRCTCRPCNVEYWFWHHVCRHKSMVRGTGRIPLQISAYTNN